VPAKPKIAYVMSRFPFLPETFILREMIEVERLGWPVALYPLILEHPPVVHESARPWVARMRPLPLFSARYLADVLGEALRRPALLFGTLARVVAGNLSSPKFLSRALALFPKAVHLAGVMRDEGVAHVHAHYATHPALAAWIVHRLTGIPYSVTAHAHDIYVDRAMLAPKLRDAAFIAAISNFNREFIERHAGPGLLSKTYVVHCGVTPAEYPLPDAPRDPGGIFEILCIGSLQPYKGQRHLVDACGLLKARGVAFRCRIVGGGELRGALERQIRDAGLGSEVLLLGPLPQEQVAALLPTAHCYCQPSVITPAGKMEGIPVAIMEAMACGLPVVATDISGIPELVGHGTTGLLVPPAEPAALAAALATIAGDPAAAFSMGRRGRRIVEEQFTLAAGVASLTSHFPGGVRA
jgi:glycosyltransferase involved in cell wall biosynthesis